MKKILWALLPLLLLLAACGVETTPETTVPYEVEIPYEETEIQLPYENVELTFRAIWWEDEPQSQVLLQAAQFFEKKTGAKVTFFWPEEDQQDADHGAQMGQRDIADLLPLGGAVDGCGLILTCVDARDGREVEHRGVAYVFP